MAATLEKTPRKAGYVIHVKISLLVLGRVFRHIQIKREVQAL